MTDLSDNVTHPHEDLWFAVLVQAVKDLRIHPGIRTGELALARRQAIEWFETAGEDFRTVCRNAGEDPARVKRLYDSGELSHRSTENPNAGRRAAVVPRPY